MFVTSMDSVTSYGQFAFELVSQCIDHISIATSTSTANASAANIWYFLSRWQNMYYDNQCVASSSGVSGEVCESMCGPQKYRCMDSVCAKNR
mmetsp:Transcript_15776/g.43031  ORF Transcript_15776/g.43031 Transcript_15776/m.43031 type:complete len:92 (+) Transcript_15776:158-433(+)